MAFAGTQMYYTNDQLYLHPQHFIQVLYDEFKRKYLKFENAKANMQYVLLNLLRLLSI